MLQIGERYTRPQVHDYVGGGNIRSYLLTRHKRVLAACIDPVKNPEAPRVILVGPGPKIQASGAWLAAQRDPIEMFLKDEQDIRDASGSPRNWVYWGQYLVVHSSTSKAEITRHALVDRPITRVIRLEPRAPNEVAPTEKFLEGACGQVTSDRRERSREARDACLRLHGYACSACGMKFEETYGEIGRGFIHVHHVEPLANRSGQYTVDVRTDLKPVCPNCHAMLHRRSPSPLTIEELQDMMHPKQRP